LVTKIYNLTPNELGIYDMSGNVFEWVNDWYGGEYYKESPKNNPAGPARGSGRVYRGGSCIFDAGGSRVSIRYYDYFSPSSRAIVTLIWAFVWRCPPSSPIRDTLPIDERNKFRQRARHAVPIRSISWPKISAKSPDIAASINDFGVEFPFGHKDDIYL